MANEIRGKRPFWQNKTYEGQGYDARASARISLIKNRKAKMK